MGSGSRLGSRTRRFTKKTLAFIVPLALLVSMMLSNAPLASAQDASPSPTADPSPTDVPTTAPTLAPSASDAPSTDAPSPTDSPSATDASPAPPPETTPTEPAAPSDTSSPAVTNYASLIVRTVPGLTDSDVAAAIAAGGGTEVSSVPGTSAPRRPGRRHNGSPTRSRRTRPMLVCSRWIATALVTPKRRRTIRAYPDQWSLPQIGWDQAYGSTTISGVSTIAVLDTGVQSSDVPTGPGWSAFGGDPGIDPNGHGTWIASIAGATTDNGQGIAGVGFDGINIMPVQVLDATGTGQDSDIIAGLVWAADHGANVAVMAFSNPGYSTALQDAVNYAWAHGVVVVAAAGNDGGTSPNYPAGDSKVVGVGATDQSDALWIGSNSSAAVFITAPGVGIKADDTIADTVSVTGTSASAAIVAGAAAQLMAADPSASPGVIVGRLARNADPDGGVGNGRVNLARALGDTSTDAVVPTGAPGGGPVVGPTTRPREHSRPSISPTSASVGVAKSYTVTVTNTSSGSPTGNIACVEIDVPTGAGTPGTFSVVANDPGPTPRTWTTPTLSGSTITTKSSTSTDDIDPTTGTVAVGFATTASTAGVKTWTTRAFAGSNATGCNGTQFTISGVQPAVTVSANSAPAAQGQSVLYGRRHAQDRDASRHRR